MPFRQYSRNPTTSRIIYLTISINIDSSLNFFVHPNAYAVIRKVHARFTGGPWEVHGKSMGTLRGGPQEVHKRSTGGPREVHGRSTRRPRGVHGRSTGVPRGVVELLGCCTSFSVTRASIKKLSQNRMYCNKQQQQTTVFFC